MTYLILLATHSGLVYDVTDTDCWAQNVSAQGRVSATWRKVVAAL